MSNRDPRELLISNTVPIGVGRRLGVKKPADLRRYAGAVQKFTRHKDVRDLNAYDDNRQDLAGDVAQLMAGE